MQKFLGNIYYKYFTESERDVNHEGTTFHDRLFYSIFYLIMLRLALGSVFYYFIEQGYTPIEPYGIANLLWALFGGYLLAPIVSALFIKTKELKLRFLKGAWIPIPMTIVWLFGK